MWVNLTSAGGEFEWKILYKIEMKFDLINRPEPEGVHYEGNERFEGYAVDLLYNLAEECKFDFHFEPVRDNKYGSYDAVSDEWDGIIRQLIDNVSSTHTYIYIHMYLSWSNQSHPP